MNAYGPRDWEDDAKRWVKRLGFEHFVDQAVRRGKHLVMPSLNPRFVNSVGGFVEVSGQFVKFYNPGETQPHQVVGHREFVQRCDADPALKQKLAG